VASGAARPDRGAEAFLSAFHDARPGLTSKAFGDLPVTVEGQVHASSYHLLADALPPRLAGASVLDLACGDGFLLSLLQTRAGPATRLVGIDLSAGELAHAQARLGPDALLCRANALALPFAAASFDAVTCHLALMLMERTAEALGEVRRVLRPGGRFAAVVGAPSPGNAVLAAYSDVLARYPRAPCWQEVRFGDRRIRSAEGIRELLAPHFSGVTVRDAALERRLPPAGVWDWLLDMYDLYLLGEADRAAIRDELLRALEPLLGPDGAVPFAQSMRLLSATAA
jgi:ubiquinone/menaquinone biosynthesis C-methylase UbiE